MRSCLTFRINFALTKYVIIFRVDFAETQTDFQMAKIWHIFFLSIIYRKLLEIRQDCNDVLWSTWAFRSASFFCQIISNYLENSLTSNCNYNFSQNTNIILTSSYFWISQRLRKSNNLTIVQSNIALRHFQFLCYDISIDIKLMNEKILAINTVQWKLFFAVNDSL